MPHMLTPPHCSHIHSKAIPCTFLPVPVAVVAISSVTELLIIIVNPCGGNNFFAYFALFGPVSAERRRAGTPTRPDSRFHRVHPAARRIPSPLLGVEILYY